MRSVYTGGNTSAWSEAVSAIVKGGVLVTFDFAADSTGTHPPYNDPKDAEPYCANAYCMTEGFTTEAKVTVKLSKALTAATTVTLAAVPIPGADPGPCDRLPCNRLYKNLPLTVNVPASTTSVAVPFVQSDRDDHADDIIVDDLITDRYRKGSFDIRLEKVAGAAYSVDPAARATVHVANDDVATISFGQAHYEVSEGLLARVRLALDKDVDFPVTVDVTTRADSRCSDLHNTILDAQGDAVAFDANCQDASDPTNGLRDTTNEPRRPHPLVSVADTPDATPGLDYSPGSERVVIPKRTREFIVLFEVLRDTIAEDDEYLVFNLGLVATTWAGWKSVPTMER